jgi:hypothetical protein
MKSRKGKEEEKYEAAVNQSAISTWRLGNAAAAAAAA